MIGSLDDALGMIREGRQAFDCPVHQVDVDATPGWAYATNAGDYLMRMLARVEGMPLESLEAGVPWDWSSFGEYLERLEGKLAVNAGFMVGHSALRRVVMGERAVATPAAATPAQRRGRAFRSRPSSWSRASFPSSSSLSLLRTEQSCAV